MPPQRSDFVLPAYIPYIEFRVLVRDSLNVEAYSRNGGDVLVELQFVEDG